MPPAQAAYHNGAFWTSRYWDDILFMERLITSDSLAVLRCPKATLNAGIYYTDGLRGRIVNTAFRQAAPAKGQPNANYVANGGWGGGGSITVPIFGVTGGTNLHHPFRYITGRGEPRYSWHATWGHLINAYNAFETPLPLRMIPQALAHHCLSGWRLATKRRLYRAAAWQRVRGQRRLCLWRIVQYSVVRRPRYDAAQGPQSLSALGWVALWHVDH